MELANRMAMAVEKARKHNTGIAKRASRLCNPSRVNSLAHGIATTGVFGIGKLPM